MIAQYFHITYKITFPDTGFYYFGKHSTKRLNDRYKGSGVDVANLIKQNARHSFEMVALHESSDAAFAHEKTLVGDRYLADPFCLNKIQGGAGVKNFKGKPGIRTPRRDKQKVLMAAKLGAEARRGMKDSPEVRARRSASVSAATTGIPKPWICKRISVDDKVYVGIGEVCKAFSISRYHVRTRLKSEQYPTWIELTK
jgi:hypothetical protein